MPTLKYWDGTAWQRLTGAAAGAEPIGSIVMWGTASAPAGYLLCDGTAYSRTSYAALFAVLGTSFGAGDGSTTFNVPDLRGRTVLGAGTASPAVAGGTAHTLAQKGGEETHVLSVGEIPAHTHTVDGPPSHSWGAQYGGGTAFATFTFIPDGINASTTYTAPLGAMSTGGSGAHNNLPPFTALNYVIKYDTAIAGADAADWIDLKFTSSLVLTPAAPTQLPFTTVVGSSGLTQVSGGQIQVNKAGVYQVNVNLSSEGPAGYVITRIAHWRGGVVIGARESVPGVGTASTWDTGTVSGIFNAQVGDLFQATGLSGVAAGLAETRQQFHAHRLAGAGPAGPQGPPGDVDVHWGGGNGIAGQALTQAMVKIPMSAGSFRGVGCTFVSAGAQAGGIQVNRAGPYHVTAVITTSGGGSGYVDAGFHVYRAGAMIATYTAVGGLAGGLTYSATSAQNTVDLQVGDIVIIVAAAQAAGLSIEGRTYLSVSRLAGSGPKGDPGAGVLTFANNFSGGWQTAVPGPTSGQLITVPSAGKLTIWCAATCYAPTQNNVQVSIYLDGVEHWSMRLNASIVTNCHMALGPAVIFPQVAAGAHYLCYRQVAGASDAGDFGSFMAIFTPN